MHRIVHLDYLRGLAALAVMLFHYQKWTVDGWDANSFLGKSGVYAVSVFFVLSGLTLTLVYEKSLSGQPAGWRAFWVKRFFRIFPLLWLCTLATVFLDETPYPTRQLLLNFSGLFGFFDPAGDIALGAWSIGDELVYYAAFPFLLWAGLRKQHLFWGVFLTSVVIGGLYAFVWTDTRLSITTQWPVYVEPLNHAFFFLSGMVLGLWRSRWKNWPPMVFKRGLAVCVLLYVFYTPGSDPSGLITGVNRVVFSLLVIGLTGSWYLAVPRFSRLPDRVLQWLGEISYSIYLLHPLVFRCLKALDARYFGGLEAWLAPVAVVLTLVAGHLSYRWVEKPAMQWGKRFILSPASPRA